MYRVWRRYGCGGAFALRVYCFEAGEQSVCDTRLVDVRSGEMGVASSINGAHPLCSVSELFGLHLAV